MSDPKWKRFEKLVAKVQSDLAPTAKVTHDEKIKGKVTKKDRQVDVCVRTKAGQFDLLVAIECKDQKQPVDVEDVEAFVTKIRDIEANHAAIVSSSGFTDGAKKVGEDAGITLYRLVDAEDHDWKTVVSVPALYEDTILDSFSFIYSSTDHKMGFTAEELSNPRNVVLYDQEGNKLGTVMDLLSIKWNKGELPMEAGQHDDVEFLDVPVQKKYNGEFCSLKVKVRLWVERNFYFGWWRLEEISGFHDEIKGGIITKKFSTSKLSHEHVKKEWKKIDNPAELAVKPMCTLGAMSVYDVDMRETD